MNIVVDATGLILMWSINAEPEPPEGGRLWNLTDEQRVALRSTVDLGAGIEFDGSAFTARPYTPPTVDLSNPDTLGKALKAILLAAGAMSGKTVAQTRAAFTTAWKALP